MRNKKFRKFIWTYYLSDKKGLVGHTIMWSCLILGGVSICLGVRGWDILPMYLVWVLASLFLTAFLLQSWLSFDLGGLGYPIQYKYTKEELDSYGMTSDYKVKK